jgi:type VI protein secretion system component Hcp
MLKQATIGVKLEKNWKGDKYITYFLDDCTIAELDFPNEYRDKPRLYPAFENISFDYDTMKTAVAVAETVAELYLLKQGYTVKGFDYPEELNEIKNEK